MHVASHYNSVPLDLVDFKLRDEATVVAATKFRPTPSLTAPAEKARMEPTRLELVKSRLRHALTSTRDRPRVVATGALRSQAIGATPTLSPSNYVGFGPEVVADWG